MNIVIGSGPAGVACASALLKAGARVTMLDAGLELEPLRRRQLAALRSTPRPAWDRRSLGFLRDGVEVNRGGIPLKLAYGSDFPYRDPLSQPTLEKGAQAYASYARGGLSNVWGASVLPYRTGDIDAWPITIDDLAPHYQAVLELMPFAARIDGLADSFPLYSDRLGLLRTSSQAGGLLADLESNAGALAAKGVRFGASRLALDAGACVYCGKCMFGCPYELIYNASQTLAQLLADPGFSYRPGRVVEQIGESGSAVEIRGREIAAGKPFQLIAERAFLAAGVFSTARVMLASLDAYERPLAALDNCYFLLPLLRRKGAPGVIEEPLYTLPQIFLEVDDPALLPRPAHLQVYTYNELYRDEVGNLLGPFRRLLPRPLEASFLGRLLLVQGYLHSDLSPGLTITLHRGGGGEVGTLEVAAAGNPRTAPALAGLRKLLWAQRRLLKALPLLLGLRVGEPGRSFHAGGTFPMGVTAGPFRTDLLGRPHGFERLHLVDASVFPSLPATTVTLSVMANAHRIGSAAVA